MGNIALIRSEKDPARREREECRESLAADYTFPATSLDVFTRTSFEAIDHKLKEHAPLSFDDTFAGMLHVLAATNAAVHGLFLEHGLCKSHPHAIARGAAFLQGMALRETYENLAVDEICGLIAAANLDLIVRLTADGPITEMCGMGGDRGIYRDGKRHKTVNATTLTAILLGGMGHYSVKHGSGKNTSAVGSTDAIRQLGLTHTFRSLEDMCGSLAENRFIYVDAALAKTLHDLSSMMAIETVNHLVGPLTLPIDPACPTNKILGVNNKVNPVTCAGVFASLRQRGLVNYRNVAVVCGFGSEEDPSTLTYRHSVLDELSPYLSEIAFVIDGTLAGTYRLTPADFGVTHLPDIWVPTEPESILDANQLALRGKGHQEYLGMNLALALLLVEATPVDFADGFPYQLLQRNYETADRFIRSGKGCDMIK